MTRNQAVAVAALVLVAMTLVVLLDVLAARKDVLRAEGADLAVAESALVDATLDELEAEADRFGSGTHVFSTVDETTRAVAVLRGTWDDVPLHDGRPLSGRPGEALVGSERAPGSDTVLVGDRTYEVVGRLGVRADSALDLDAVVADPALFPSGRGALRIDGPAAVAHYRSAFPGRPVEVVDRATNRRTDVDVVTPVLTTAGTVLAALVTGVAARSAIRGEHRSGRVRFRTGHSRASIVAGAAARAASVGALCAVVVAVAGRVLADGLFVPAPSAAEPATIGLAFAAVTAGGTWAAGRRWS